MEPSIQVNRTKFTPEIGLRGTYTLLPPFDTKIAQAIYTCQAVRTISSLVATGEDVYETYYKPFGISEDIYDADEQRDATIITLLTESGTQLHFPVGYLESYPDMNGVPYQATHLYVHLPPFPRDHDFSLLIEGIQDLAKTFLGVPEVLVRPVVASETSLVPNDTHAATQAQREAAKEVSTPSLQAEMWRQRYEALKREHDQLLAYATANAP